MRQARRRLPAGVQGPEVDFGHLVALGGKGAIQLGLEGLETDRQVGRCRARQRCPVPSPAFLVVKYGSKISVIISGDIPYPVS